VRGRHFFNDRAAARDLAYFVRSRRVHQLRLSTTPRVGLEWFVQRYPGRVVELAKPSDRVPKDVIGFRIGPANDHVHRDLFDPSSLLRRRQVRNVQAALEEPRRPRIRLLSIPEKRPQATISAGTGTTVLALIRGSPKIAATEDDGRRSL